MSSDARDRAEGFTAAQHGFETTNPNAEMYKLHYQQILGTAKPADYSGFLRQGPDGIGFRILCGIVLFCVFLGVMSDKANQTLALDMLKGLAVSLLVIAYLASLVWASLKAKGFFKTIGLTFLVFAVYLGLVAFAGKSYVNAGGSLDGLHHFWWSLQPVRDVVGVPRGLAPGMLAWALGFFVLFSIGAMPRRARERFSIFRTSAVVWVSWFVLFVVLPDYTR